MMTFATRRTYGKALGSAAIALAAITLAGANAQAATTIVTPANFGATTNWYATDQQGGSSSQFSSDQSENGNGSYLLSLSTATNSKITLFHAGGDGLSLSDFTAPNTTNVLGFDYYKDGASTSPVTTPAFHLYVGNYSAQLVWEGDYNGITTNTTNSWQSVNITNDKYWLRLNGVNDQSNADAKTLAGWQTDPRITGDGYGTNIVDYSVGLGQPWGGSYNAYVDNVKYGSSTSRFENPSAAPEPSQLAGLGFTAFGALGLILKARKKKAQAAAA